MSLKWKGFKNKVLPLWDFIFWTFFLVSVWFYTKCFRKKSPILVEIAREQRMFSTIQKRGNRLKKTLDIFNMQMLIKKVLFIKRLRLDLIFTRLRIFFLQNFNSCYLISWDYIGSPHIIVGKKSQESKSHDFVSYDILS